MKTIIKIVDRVSEWSGQIFAWACVALVIVVVYEVVARYVFDAPTIWGYETSMMLGATTVAMGWAYTHLHKGHVRVDVFYTNLSHRGKAILDVICTIIFFFPLFAVLLVSSSNHMVTAWVTNEKLSESYWFPPAWPIRTVMFLGTLLFVFQGCVQFIRDLYILLRRETL